MDRKIVDEHSLGPCSYNCSECGTKLVIDSLESYCPKCGLVEDDTPFVNPSPDNDGRGYGKPNRLTGILEPTEVPSRI